MSELAARLGTTELSTGEGPLPADTPADRGARNDDEGPGPLAEVTSPVAARDGGQEPKRRKRRRRKRRRPVYAPGTGPASRVDGQPVEAVSALPANEVDRKLSQDLASAAGAFYGALDLGTNNCRLLVATPRVHGFRVVDAFSRIVRLGEGIGANGRLSDAAMRRSIEALKVCSAKLADRSVTRARLIATEACRTADNGAEFVERVRVEVGLELEIVSQEAEARLAVAGCASLVDPRSAGVILFDIGGGSSEIVWIDLTSPDGRRRRMPDRIRRWMSLPVGVVNLSERHGGRHVDRDLFEMMVLEVSAMVANFPEAEALDQAVADGGVHMLGTSGTVTTLAGVHLNLPRYDRRRVDGTWLAGGDVAELIGTLAAMDYDARVANPCIGRERADLVLAGCAILEAIRRRWPCDRLRVADRGLREGLLVELMSADGVWRTRPKRYPDGPLHG
jgi:exopolyphosphatase / guanosine-5'-triphosphate,3'-diphosphate pyrophosphatase